MDGVRLALHDLTCRRNNDGTAAASQVIWRLISNYRTVIRRIAAPLVLPPSGGLERTGREAWNGQWHTGKG